ncbi:MAG: glutamate decarboxylase [Chlorobi bacterium]|nr:glutamate decarboxylase [Chlorobiota bacterium]
MIFNNHLPITKQVDRRILRRLFRMIGRYLNQNNSPDTPVLHYLEPDNLKKRMDLTIGEAGMDNEWLVKILRKYLRYSVRTTHRNFSNQLFSAFNFPSFIGEIIATLTNTTMATYEAAPLGTLIEQEIIDKMNRLIGFKTEDNPADGIMVPGGSYANLMGLMCARYKAVPETKEKGINGIQFRAFVSDEAHYSFKKMMNVLGLGTNALTEIPSDEHGRIKTDLLENAIKQSLKRGEKPFFIGATAGTTVYGAFDPFREMAAIARKYNLWLHVDGAWGGTLLLYKNKKSKELLDGIQLADSFTWDAHKMMGVPLYASFFLCKHDGLMHQCNAVQGAEYLFHSTENTAFDTGPKSLQCGRRVDALKVWLAWKFYGDKGYHDMITDLYSKVNYLKKLINQNPWFELINDPQYFNVCFRVVHPKIDIDLNEINLEIRERLFKSGNYFTNYSVSKSGTVFFRLIVNPNSTKNDYRNFLNKVIGMTEAILKEKYLPDSSARVFD